MAVHRARVYQTLVSTDTFVYSTRFVDARMVVAGEVLT
jgi:hypothetical protein